MTKTPKLEEQLQTLKASKEAAELLWHSFEDGGMTIETPFTLGHNSYSFTTVIQLDADIINYFPNLCNEDLRLYQPKLSNVMKKHWYEVEFAFFKLSNNKKLWNLLSDTMVVFINAISVITMLDVEKLESVLVMLIPLAYVFFRKKIIEHISPLIVRSAFFVYKKFKPLLDKVIKNQKASIINS
ncbi:hypothetical protein [Flammeovirga agarivorans]|uniref:Uncharacterized protein n=1 Tax=Flammeovirga agarivorans TaxID=2726742 RepID=A0A7X8SHK3_9BACT|nr:hypothetical protein [Flammeovirga agarivorans]NLR90248.1 hypothetical protein [Flammeovirga agarivorans]